MTEHMAEAASQNNSLESQSNALEISGGTQDCCFSNRGTCVFELNQM